MKSEFMNALHQRLDAGAKSYGDKSFDRPLPQLLHEMQQEALDIAGWGYVVWERISQMRPLAEQIEYLADRQNTRNQDQ